jgi:acetoacetyl-CoA reductase
MNTKVALVTGAMGGLGTAMCQALAKDGYKVAANCLPDFPPAPEWMASQKALGYDSPWSPRSPTSWAPSACW